MRVKESPGRAGAFKESLTRTSRDQGALDAPIVSQSANQARRGSYKRPTRRGATHRRVGPGHDGPWARGARHDQLTNATLAAWSGKQKPRYGSDAGLLIRAQGSGPSKLRERPPASRSNPHTDHFDPAPADGHVLDGRRREPSVDKLHHQLGLEPVGQHDRLGAAVDGCLKQFERSTALLVRRGHRCVAYSSLSSLALRNSGLAPRPARSSGPGRGLAQRARNWRVSASCLRELYPKSELPTPGRTAQHSVSTPHKSGKARIATALPMGSRKTLRPSDNRHCASCAKNTDENHVAASERKATTEAREQGKSDQLP